ncbi:MAG: hypothetical protein M3Z64_03160, partial [Verrucomicrobiota bacterium]|nr:hypothetical protein [Verrucomicrobiota bacterium]
MIPRHLLSELKRRNVYKVAAAYGVVAWSLIQIATQVFPFFDIPRWGGRIVVLLIVLAFPFALFGAWTFELTEEGLRRRKNGESNSANRLRGNRWLWATMLVFAAIAVGSIVYAFLRSKPAPPMASSASANSIAVLPFASLSDAKDNAYFATAIQDEVLTRLAKIGGLTVISRTSTERYRSAPENLREIARQLGVTTILEGSVQKNGEKARINVQLIRAENDSHLWAEIYDRDLTDLFAVESEVAEKIAQSLHVQLTGGEKKALAAKPTEDPAAYDAYLRGLAFEARNQTALTYENIARYFGEAVRIDPKFALAWAHLSTASSFIYFNQWEHTPARRAAASDAAETAVRLQPELGDGYLARGYFHYYCEQDYAAASRDFEEARRRMPNDPEVLTALAYLERRKGEWDKALSHLEQAAQVDPRNVLLLYEWGSTDAKLRRFSTARGILDRALDIAPDNADLIGAKAATFQAEGNLKAAAGLLGPLPPQAPDSNPSTLQKYQMLYERRYADLVSRCQAELARPGELEGSTRGLVFFLLGLAKLRAGDAAAAQAAFTEGRTFLQGLGNGAEDDPDVAAYLALNCAALGDRAAALSHAARAIELTRRDAMLGPLMELNAAQVHALLGDVDDVVGAIPHLLTEPAAHLTPALLQLDPLWDAVAKDQRFQ